MKLLTSLLVILSAFQLSAQELNCQVTVQSNPKLDITTTEKEILKELEQSIYELMNNTVWTKDQYNVEERINCAMQLSIIEVSGGGSYKATLQVQSTRPVFNSSYNTTVFNFLDEDIAFNYRRGTKVIYSENQYTDNLTSVLAFYAYYIIGLDGDSFAPNGGTPYLREAQNIVTLAQSSMSSGWRSDAKNQKSRFWLIDNSLQELFAPLRECFYDYHRKGLDVMYDNKIQARNEIQAALEKLNKVNNTRPESVNLINFLTAKRNEIGGIFADAEPKQKADMLNLLKKIDPVNTSKYQEILQ
ncbi:MAG: DUF4835 family protein [Brumimicrobium sp.]|nr:DUF4835 family protein [Brumimicrobium sp.]